MATPEISNMAMLSADIVSDISHEGEFLSLDDRIRDAFVTTSVDMQNRYDKITTMFSDAESLSSPANFLKLQVELSDYRQTAEMLSAVVRKGVGTIETLLRA